jgi:hypothetical protein
MASAPEQMGLLELGGVAATGKALLLQLRKLLLMDEEQVPLLTLVGLKLLFAVTAVTGDMFHLYVVVGV